MKKITAKHICMIPMILLFVVIPLIVKVKFYANPLMDFSWYSNETALADFFLYYKSQFVTLTGVIMLLIFSFQISKMKRKDKLLNADTRIFIPLLVYLALTILSSIFSKYGYFCTHGMPDQFETIWNLITYVISVIYCYYIVVYQDTENSLLSCMFVGAALVGVICVLQFLKIDIYRLIYADDGYSFTFEEGTVYGPFYNTNYVGFYSLLFIPLFLLLCLCYKDWKVKVISAILVIALLVSMIGAKSITAIFSMIGVFVFAVLFLLLQKTTEKKIYWFPITCIVLAGIISFVALLPRIGAYLQSTDIEKTDLENIYTYDDYVEVDYKGQQLYIQMFQDDEFISFILKDQDQKDVPYEFAFADNYYYTITDARFDGMTLTPAMITDDPVTYGFMIRIDEKNWCFTNQVAGDGTYYYYTDIGKLTKLTPETVSEDFAPLVKYSSLASGRGYIWNKTIPLLKDYILFGSGADTYALVYPNGDFVDKYNNGYDHMILTKPHNLYLQIAVQSGVVSLICFLIFYIWYFISSLKIYFRCKLDNSLVVAGFGIMLGTLGYMISGIMNDSTITITPMYWALLGIGIGINHKISTSSTQQ